MTKHLMLAVGLAAAFAPKCAYAVDGVTLINQSTVMAAGGFPYVIVQPGSYKLSGNLVAPAGLEAMIITATNVTLDLGGFSVTCSFGVPTKGVVSCIGDAGAVFSGSTDVTIRDGAVFMTQTAGATSNFNVAMAFGNSTNLILEDLHIEVANSGGAGQFPFNLFFGVNSIIRHNIFSNSGLGGGVVEGCPSLIEGNVNATGNFGTTTITGGLCFKVNNVGAI